MIHRTDTIIMDLVGGAENVAVECEWTMEEGDIDTFEIVDYASTQPLDQEDVDHLQEWCLQDYHAKKENARMEGIKGRKYE